MFEVTDTRPDADVSEREYKRLLGFPEEHVLEGRVRDLADWARDWYEAHGRPWIYARPANATQLANERVSLEGMEFSSKRLHDQLAAAGATSTMLLAVSAGPECEVKARELWENGNPDQYFFLEVFGSAVVEHLIMFASGRICSWAEGRRLVALPHYSPGYSGWDVADQHKLWSLFKPQRDDKFPGELNVLETGMLRPKKSLLAVIGLTENGDVARHYAGLVPCENCALPNCQYRRAPRRHFLPQAEDVRRLQPGPSKSLEAESSPLSRNAKYSVNPRALRKWSEERLALKTLPGGSVEARFRYDGTTCSNLGQPLEFHYRVLLAPPRDGYRITEADCAPSPGDSGHRQQCAYLNDAVALMGCIASEKPLLGQPLDAVLVWSRPANPAGCYCDLESRNHKWGLVLEVIHFALVQRRQRGAGI
jgi:hypothetical protein